MSDTARTVRHSDSYVAGFMSKLAEARSRHWLDKSAKSVLDMTPAERAASAKAYNDYAKSVMEKYSPIVEKEPTNFSEWVGDKARFAGRKVKSYGMGLASGLGAAGVRAGQGVLESIMFVPGLADNLIAGKLFNVDEGRGFFGRALGEVNRRADGLVHSMRDWSDSYDRRHGLSSDFNRFVNGVGADVTGTAFGLLGGGSGLFSIAKRLAKNRAAKAGVSAAVAAGKAGKAGKAVKAKSKIGIGTPIWLGLGGFAGYTGSNKELRDREAMIRNVHPMFKRYYDPTATRTNVINAPTVEEYRKHFMQPYTGVHATGRVRVPRDWWHQRNWWNEKGLGGRNMPVVFNEPE